MNNYYGNNETPKFVFYGIIIVVFTVALGCTALFVEFRYVEHQSQQLTILEEHIARLQTEKEQAAKLASKWQTQAQDLAQQNSSQRDIITQKDTALVSARNDLAVAHKTISDLSLAQTQNLASGSLNSSASVLPTTTAGSSGTVAQANDGSPSSASDTTLFDSVGPTIFLLVLILPYWGLYKQRTHFNARQKKSTALVAQLNNKIVAQREHYHAVIAQVSQQKSPKSGG